MFVDGGPLLLRAWMRQVRHLKTRFKIDIVWVTSGAIASARVKTRRDWHDLPQKQALSALGQPMLMDAYNLGLQHVGLVGAQVLLTYDDINRRPQRQNLKNTLRTLLKWNVVPILNENDAVATEEIQFGDNDLLSAKVAGLLEADQLIIMTNVDGLYDRDPRQDKKAQVVSQVPRVTKSLLQSLNGRAKSKLGSGGMFSKMTAAAYAKKKNIPTVIIKGDSPDILLRIARGDRIGTRVG